MYSDWVLLPALVVLIWLLILSILVWQNNKFISKLFPKSGEKDLRKKFEETMQQADSLKTDLGDLKDKLARLEKQGFGHIQKVGLLRYNPYQETGGDISFSLSFLDKEGNGVVLTSLHSRAGTRVFAKPVVKGEPKNYQFSKEEEQTVKKALLV